MKIFHSAQKIGIKSIQVQFNPGFKARNIMTIFYKRLHDNDTNLKLIN